MSGALPSGDCAETRGVSGPMRGSRHTQRPASVCVSSSLHPPPPLPPSSPPPPVLCVCLIFKAELTLDSPAITDRYHNVNNRNNKIIYILKRT